MYRLSEEIRTALPAGLVPAVEALSQTLDDAHFKCGKITEVFCYALLHPGENPTDTEQYKLALDQLKVIAGPAATEAYHRSIRMGTAPAFFHAMEQLYIAGMIPQAVRVFHDLLAIGKANAEQLSKPYIQWAHDLTMKLIETYEIQVKLWIRAVCDPPDYSSDMDWSEPDEVIMGRTWCAPMLLVMKPSRYMPFDAARQWERVDRETSKKWLKSFAEMFTIGIKIHIDRLAGEKTLELAKQPKPAQNGAGNDGLRQEAVARPLGAAARADNRHMPDNARCEAVDAYIEEVYRQTGKRITRTDIWKSARYKSRTEFERWQRCDARATSAAHERFTRILAEKPHLK